MDRIITIDRVGRLVIPKDLRVRHGLQPGSRLRVDDEQGRIILEPLEESSPLVEQGGLLLVDAALEGPPVDHRQLREKHLSSLVRRPE